MWSSWMERASLEAVAARAVTVVVVTTGPQQQLSTVQE
jgi:hypothetical protein